MTTHAEPLRLLCLSPDYLALVLDNERREDPVRAAAADDHAEETLDAKGWEAYALTRRMTLPDDETALAPAVTIDGKRVWVFSSSYGEAWAVHSLRRAGNSRGKRVNCYDLAHAALVVALMMDNAEAKAARRKTERDIVKKSEADFLNPFQVGQHVIRSAVGAVGESAFATIIKVNAKSVVVEHEDGRRFNQKCVNIVRKSGGWNCDLPDYLVRRPWKWEKAS